MPILTFDLEHQNLDTHGDLACNFGFTHAIHLHRNARGAVVFALAWCLGYVASSYSE